MCGHLNVTPRMCIYIYIYIYISIQPASMCAMPEFEHIYKHIYIYIYICM
jgi:hypothetical protein